MVKFGERRDQGSIFDSFNSLNNSKLECKNLKLVYINIVILCAVIEPFMPINDLDLD